MQSKAKRFDKLAVPKELLIVYTYNQHSIHIF
jgi:hypothetical protein